MGIMGVVGRTGEKTPHSRIYGQKKVSSKGFFAQRFFCTYYPPSMLHIEKMAQSGTEVSIVLLEYELQDIKHIKL